MSTYTSFRPGQVWLDTDGKPIQAHGGGIYSENGIYYWFGEDKSAPTNLDSTRGSLHRADVVGVRCYSSSDLYNWKNEGLVLPAVPDNPNHDLHPSRVAERPKVIFNHSTGQYVLWLHIDSADYAYARAGIAVAGHPTGPYQYLGSLRPNGGMSRDMTLFQDEDGQVYQYASSQHNATLQVSRLRPDSLAPNGEKANIFKARFREAPAIFKHLGRYYAITSGCTGWDPNPAEIASARHPFGPWKRLGNPCRGPDAQTTFNAQSTFVLPLPGKEGAFIFLADIWKKDHLEDSRYVWLPLQWVDGKFEIHWLDEWDLSFFR